MNRRTFINTVGGSGRRDGRVAIGRVHLARGGRAVRLESRSGSQPSGGLRPPVRFAAIGLNHSHVNSQVETVLEHGGELAAVFAKEPELVAAFTKRFPQAKVARTEQEILDDKAVQLVVSAAIPNERAALGIRVMQHGKDFMVDKPGRHHARAARRSPQGAGRHQAD